MGSPDARVTIRGTRYSNETRRPFLAARRRQGNGIGPCVRWSSGQVALRSEPSLNPGLALGEWREGRQRRGTASNLADMSVAGGEPQEMTIGVALDLQARRCACRPRRPD